MPEVFNVRRKLEREKHQAMSQLQQRNRELEDIKIKYNEVLRQQQEKVDSGGKALGWP